MLLAVVARRLGMPDFVTALVERSRAWREDGARRRAESAQAAARAQLHAIEEQQRLRDAILARRQRDAQAARELPVVSLQPVRSVDPPMPPAAPPTPPPAATAAERPLTAAERLALKRRERR
jgi:hypothetical protein